MKKEKYIDLNVDRLTRIKLRLLLHKHGIEHDVGHEEGNYYVEFKIGDTCICVCYSDDTGVLTPYFVSILDIKENNSKEYIL